MANLQESAVWEDGIYQWETEDPVVGGADGIDNVPTRQLANRTAYLKERMELKADKEFVENAMANNGFKNILVSGCFAIQILA